MIVGIIAAVKSSPNITGIKIDKIIDSIITKKKLQKPSLLRPSMSLWQIRSLRF